ncbi:hypothetical protein QT15_19900 [Pseudoalteromonas flavipulchra NCIMB 2033 = ATCC BAA-314]|nr:hypothetical protein QT15_19900 [Pseudoalteromonas flavipulchra NCIMB 2033 = ATCC BAA-314]
MGEKAQGREYIKEAEVAPHQEPGYKHAITLIMLKVACTIGGVHIRRFTREKYAFQVKKKCLFFCATILWASKNRKSWHLDGR